MDPAALSAALDNVRSAGMPGVFAEVRDGDQVWRGASGVADVTSGLPVTPDMRHRVGSITKTFTAAAVMHQVEGGRVQLDTPVGHYLPRLVPAERGQAITVRMLLNHTSGLADYFLNPKIDVALQRDPTRRWTAADALKYVGKRLSPPGKAWHYANTNYLLLGLIVERLTGNSLAVEIRDRFLTPLGLTATWYQAVEKPRTELAHGYRFSGTKLTAKPIDLTDGSGIAPFRSVVTAADGAGSMAGTSADLARWGRALYGGDVLGPIGTALLLSDFTKTTGYLPGASYGFGVQALSIDGHASLGHSGRLLGFRGVVRHFPVDGFTIAVLTNQSRTDPGAVVRSLLRVLAPPPPAPVGSPGASPDASPSPSASASVVPPD